MSNWETHQSDNSNEVFCTSKQSEFDYDVFRTISPGTCAMCSQETVVLYIRFSTDQVGEHESLCLRCIRKGFKAYRPNLTQ